MEKSSRYSELFKSSNEETNKRISQWWQYLDYTGLPRPSLFEPLRSPLFDNTDVIENRRLNPEHIQVLRNATINFAESTLPDFGLRYYEEELKKKRKSSYSDTYLLNNTPQETDETENLVFKKPLFNRQRNERRFSSAFESNEKSNTHKIDKVPSTLESNEKRLSDDLEMNVRQKNLFNRKHAQKKRNFSDAFEFEDDKGNEEENPEKTPQADQIETVTNTSISARKRKNLFERKPTKKRNFSSAFTEPLISPTKRSSQEITTKKNEQAIKHPENIQHLEVSENDSKVEESSSDTIKSFDNLLSSTKINANSSSTDIRKRMSLFKRTSYNESPVDIMRNVTNLVSQPSTLSNLKINIQNATEPDVEFENINNPLNVSKKISSLHTSQKSQSIRSENLPKISAKSAKTIDKNSEGEYETFSDIDNTVEAPKNKNIFNRQKNDSEIEKSKNSSRNPKNLSTRKSTIRSDLQINENEHFESEKSNVPEIEDRTHDSYNLRVNKNKKSIIHKSHYENTDSSQSRKDLHSEPTETHTLRRSQRRSSQSENIQHRKSEVNQIQSETFKRNSSRASNKSRKTIENDDDGTNVRRSRRNLSQSPNKSKKIIEYDDNDTINTRRSTRNLSQTPKEPRKTMETNEEDMQVARRSKRNLSQTPNKSRKIVEYDEENVRKSGKKLSQSRNQTMNHEEGIETDARRSRRNLSQSPNRSKKTEEYDDDLINTQRSRRNLSRASNKSTNEKPSSSSYQDQNEIESDSPKNHDTSGNEQYLSQPESVKPQFTSPNNSRSKTSLSDLSKKYLDEARIREIKHRKISTFPETDSDVEVKKSQFFNVSKNLEDSKAKPQQNHSEFESNTSKDHHVNKSSLHQKEFYNDEIEIGSGSEQNLPESDYETEIRRINQSKSRSQNRSRLQADLPESESDIEIRKSQSISIRDQNENRSRSQRNIREFESEADIRRSQISNASRSQNKSRYTLQETIPESGSEIRRSQVSNASTNLTKNRYTILDNIPELGNEAEISRSQSSNISRSKNRFTIQENIPEFESEAEIRRSHASNTSRNQSKSRRTFQEYNPESESEVEIRRSHVSNISRNQTKSRFTLQENIPESENETEIRRSQVSNISRNQNENKSRFPESETEDDMRRSQSKISKIPVLQKVHQTGFDNKIKSYKNKLSGRITNEMDDTPEIETGQDIVERIENSRKSGDDSDIGSTIRSTQNSRSSFTKNSRRSQFTTDDYDSHVSQRNVGIHTKSSRYFELYEAPDRKTVPSQDDEIRKSKINRVDRRTFTINTREETDEDTNTSRSKMNRIDRRTFTKNTQEETDEATNTSSSMPKKNRINRRTFTKNVEKTDEAINTSSSSSKMNRIDRRTYTKNIEEEPEADNLQKMKFVEYEKEVELSSDEENFIMNLSKGKSGTNENPSKHEIETEENLEKSFESESDDENYNNIQISDIAQEVNDLQETSKEVSKAFDEHIRVSRAKNTTMRGTEDMEQTKLRKSRENEETYSSDEDVFFAKKSNEQQDLFRQTDESNNVNKKVRNVTRRTLVTIESDDFDINIHKNKEMTKNMTIRPNESMEQTKLMETSPKKSKDNQRKSKETASPKSGSDEYIDNVLGKKKDVTQRATESMEQTLINKSIPSDKSMKSLNSSINKNKQHSLVFDDLNPDLSPMNFTEISRRVTRSRADSVNENKIGEPSESPVLSKRQYKRTKKSNVQKSTQKKIEDFLENESDIHSSPQKTTENESKKLRNTFNEDAASTKRDEQNVENLQKSLNKVNDKSKKSESNVRRSARKNLSHFLKKEVNTRFSKTSDKSNQNENAQETRQNIERIVDIIENYKGPPPETKMKMRKIDVLFERMREIQKNKKPEKPKIKTVKKPLPPWKCMPNGEPIPKPKLYKSEKWMTKLFYKHLEKRLESQFGIDNTLKAEEIMKKLGDVSKTVRKSKKYEGKCIEELKILLAKYGIIKTTYDFYFFIMDWLPIPLRERMVPMSLPKSHVAKIIVPKSTTSVMENILK